MTKEKPRSNEALTVRKGRIPRILIVEVMVKECRREDIVFDSKEAKPLRKTKYFLHIMLPFSQAYISVES